MKSRSRHHEVALPPDLDLVGGDVALNFVNTLRADAGEPLETLHSDRDVRAWMRKMGVREPVLAGALPQGELLERARELRGLALSALLQKTAGKRVPLTGINGYLEQAVSQLRLRRADEGDDSLNVDRVYRAESAVQFLAPIAEAIARLLAEADFELIHRCEGAGCVLWFADRPSGRARRFCTEETCGTRARVAAYRARQAQAKAAAEA